MKKHDEALMTWGTGGKLDYAIVARKAAIGLSIKFYGLADGVIVQQPGKTYVVFRLRSSDVADALQMAGESFEPNDAFKPDTAWPAVQWERGDVTYRSTSIGFLVEANKTDPKGFYEAVTKIDYVENFLTKLIALADGPEHLTLSKQGLAAYLDGTLGTVIETAKKAGEQVEVVNKTVSAQPAGAFFLEGEILAKLAGKTKPPNLDKLGLNGPENDDQDDEDGKLGFM